jgi:uncharacterized protein YutE (UPF0331/DUF86 family)
LKKEIRFRLVKHLTFLEAELKDYEVFKTLSWKEYNEDRGKRRNVERWIENIINSSIDIAKLILTSEDHSLPDTYKDIVKNLSLVPNFSEEGMEKLSRWVSLRNIISHEYLDIRWTSIQKFTSGSEPFYEEFLKKVQNYIKEHQEEE